MIGIVQVYPNHEQEANGMPMQRRPFGLGGVLSEGRPWMRLRCLYTTKFLSNRLSGVARGGTEWGGAEEEERRPSRDGFAAMDGGDGSSKAEEGGDIEV